MEWYIALIIILGLFLVLMFIGFPVAFSFMAVNIISVFWWWGGLTGFNRLVISIYDSVTLFILLPVVLFIFMGVMTLESGIAPVLIEAVDKWIGRLPGRLSLLAVGAGVLFSTLTGEPVASVAMLGKSLVPEMEKRGYKKEMSMGSILASAGLAMLIPPSSLAVFLGAVGQISIGQILIGMIIPGLILAVLFSTYIIVLCKLKPSLAPPYEIPDISLAEKIMPTIKYILPVGVVIFLVIGVIFLGIVTPSEAAATGVLGVLILAVIYKGLNRSMMVRSLRSSVEIVVMVFMIIASAKAFGQTLAFTGASKGLVQFAASLPVMPIITFIAIQVIIVILGMFMEPASIIMITLPVCMPIMHALGFNDVWFGVVTLVNIQIGMISPPFGMSLFVMQGVAPRGTTMGDVYRAALPFFGMNLVGLVLIIAFPSLILWLPSLMRPAS